MSWGKENQNKNNVATADFINIKNVCSSKDAGEKMNTMTEKKYL